MKQSSSRILLWLLLAGFGGLLLVCLCLAGLLLWSSGRSGTPPPPTPTREALAEAPGATAASPVSPFTPTAPPATMETPLSSPTPEPPARGLLLITRKGIWVYDFAIGQAYSLRSAPKPADLGREFYLLDPAGEYLAYLSADYSTEPFQLVLLDLQTERSKTLQASDPDATYQAWAHDTGYPSFAWSPEGDGLAFVAPGAHGDTDVFFFDLATGKTNLLAKTPNYAAALFWSPSGQRLLFADVTWPENSVSSQSFVVRSLGVWDKTTNTVVTLPGTGYQALFGWLDDTRFLVGSESSFILLDVNQSQAQRITEFSYTTASPVAQGAVLFATEDGGYLWQPDHSPQRLLDGKIWEFDPLPEAPGAFYAYPRAVVTTEGQVYPSPRPELSYHPALSSQGHMAWVVADAYANAHFQVVVQEPGSPAPTVQMDVPKSPAFLLWAPDARSLWLGLSSGTIMRMAPPEYLPETVASLPAEPQEALWLP